MRDFSCLIHLRSVELEPARVHSNLCKFRRCLSSRGSICSASQMTPDTSELALGFIANQVQEIVHTLELRYRGAMSVERRAIWLSRVVTEMNARSPAMTFTAAPHHDEWRTGPRRRCRGYRVSP
jgi:hypothetical protein